MKGEDLARKLARQTHQSEAQARDELDALVHRIVQSLRQGRAVELPEVGRVKVPRRQGKPRA